MKFYNVKKEEVLSNLQVDADVGLEEREVEKRIKKYGFNEFKKHKKTSIWQKIVDSLSEFMMVILLIAAAISFLIGEIHDAIGIICAVAIGITIGIVTEGRSQRAAEALSKMTEDIAVKVLRQGKIRQVHKSEIVPGDIVLVETGDRIPADGRLIESLDLKVREDMLTGESDDVKKNADAMVEMKAVKIKGKDVVQEVTPADQKNMVFGGTLVAYGKGKFVVTATGDHSEMGQIASYLNESDLETPLQVKLGDLGSKISTISSAIASLIFILLSLKMILNKTVHIDVSGVVPFLKSIEPIKSSFIICVALIVAAVPEGLPTMINMTLAITMKKMAKINALVRKKEACETIGSISVICSDKTGTLTQNKMSVEKVYLGSQYIQPEESYKYPYFVDNCLLNSTADIQKGKKEVKYLGSATECALLVYHKDVDYMVYRHRKKVIYQNPFSSDKKRMSTIIEDDRNLLGLCKGAPEVILSLCRYEENNGTVMELTKKRKEEILKEIEKLQKQSMRILGFSYKKLLKGSNLTYQIKDLEKDMVFSGFVGIKDPLRPDVKEAVETALQAGVETKMLTGDNINTAIAIGEELGLLNSGKRAVEATYIDHLSEEELQKEIKNIAIVARSKPDTKMRIVQALQKNKEVVAVTGDGINDAPALTKADVGIAMGIAGTEVSKSASDIILTDDSFSTIIQGIKWGRGIYENFQRFIQFQITVNFIAFLVAILSVIFNFKMPFTTIQLLWVNIIMDGPPALSLGLEPVRRAVLNRKPTDRNASIITKSMLFSMIFNACYITFVLLFQMYKNPLGVAENEMRTVLFSLFAFSVLFNAFNCREFGFNSIMPNFYKNTIALYIISITIVAQIFITEIFSNFFNTVPLDTFTWFKIIGTSSLVILVNEIAKLIGRLFIRKTEFAKKEVTA